jgi:hypothetical protein
LPWTELILQKRVVSNDLNLKYSSRVSVLFIYLFLITIMIGVFISYILLASFTFALGLLILNRDVYSFFVNKRGICFALLVIPWHWLYYFYSGLAFLIGFSKNMIKANWKR